jgi:ankyrin repeat protein
LAALLGHVEVVILLLEAKASLTVKDDTGRGPRLGDVMGF